MYRRRGKIRWVKHLRIQPYEVFCGNTFTVHWPSVFILLIYVAKNSRENFRSTLQKQRKPRKVSSANLPHLR